MVIPVGWSGTSLLATFVLLTESLLSTAPGFTPLLSCDTKASWPSGAYATPCRKGFVVGTRATVGKIDRTQAGQNP
jgi:hypothetical protein